MVVAGTDSRVAVKGIGPVVFTRIGTPDQIIVTSTFSAIAIAENNEVGRIGYSENGVRQLGKEYVLSTDPILTVTSETYSAIEIGWKSNRGLRQITGENVRVPFIYEPIAVDNNAAINNNEALLTLVMQDSDVEGAVKTEHLSVPLVRQNFASFNPAIPNSFAIGTGGATKFSTDLIRKTVVLIIPITLPTATELVPEIADYSVSGTIVTTEEEMAIIVIPSVTPSFQDAGLVPFQTPRDQPFIISKVPGQCQSYRIIMTGKKVFC